MTEVISRTDLRAAIAAGAVTVVDALGGAYYEQQHLPGAVPLTEGEVADLAGRVLPNRRAAIVTYCSNEACPNSRNVARLLTAAGYTDVRTYPAGIQDWVAAGLPVETGAFEHGPEADPR
ncbi:MAG: rhodanese-like domain-containing protein [Nocardioides sp.]